MNSLSSRVHRRLEECPRGLLSVREWKATLGDNYAWFFPRYLRYIGELVSLITEPNAEGVPTEYAVYFADPDDAWMVDPEDDAQTDLSRDEIQRLQFDAQSLAEEMCGLLGQPSHRLQRLNDRGEAFSLGTLDTGKKRSLYLLASSSANVSRKLFEPVFEGDGVPVLLYLSTQALDARMHEQVEKRKGECHPVSDFFAFAPHGLVLTKDLAAAVAPFESKQFDRWPLERPENPAWSQIAVTFHDVETFHIRFGPRGREFHYRDIRQFINEKSRTKEPNVAYSLLLRFAAYAAIPALAKHDEGYDQQKKARHRLETALKSFFELSESPFQRSVVDDFWLARFRIDSSLDLNSML